MKIAILTSGLLPVPAFQGGAVENLVDYYININEKEQLHEITVISVANIKVPRSFLRQNFDNTRYIHFNTYKYWYRFLRKVFKLTHCQKRYYHYCIEYYLHKALKHIRKNRYDIIVLENRPGYADRIAKVSPESKIVLHLHNDFLSPDVMGASTLKSYLTSTIAVSDFIKKRVDAVTPLKPSYTCYNGVDLEHFKEITSISQMREKLKLKKNDFVVVFSGRIIAEKGVKELLYAMHFLNCLPIKFLIIGGNFYGNDIGSTDYINSLHSYAERYTDRIIFTGFRSYDEIPTLLNCSDICVIPSIWDEPFSMICVEAMAAGLPLIVTKSGGMQELVNEDCAVVLDLTDNLSKRIADSILDLYYNKEKRENMSIAAKEHSKLFSKERYAKNFLRLLDA